MISSSRRGRETVALRLDGLRDSTDLVDLDTCQQKPIVQEFQPHLKEESVARLLLDGSLDSLGVGDQKVVTDDLNLGGGVVVGPSLEVVLVKGVLDGADVVLLGQLVVVVGELGTGEVLGRVGVGVLPLLNTATKGTIRRLTLKSRSYLPSL
jgi:hypothetical protein